MPYGKRLWQGVDSLEHGNFQNDDSLQALRDSRTVWVPTLVTVRNLSGKERFPDEEIDKIRKTQEYAVKKAYEYGIPMASGTDAGAWMVFHGESLEQEYQGFASILGSRERAEICLEQGNARIEAVLKKKAGSFLTPGRIRSGSNGFPDIVDKKLSDFRIFSQTLQDTFHGKTGLFELNFPGVFFLSGHVIGGMISGHDHKRSQDHFTDAGFLHCL